MTQGDSTNVSVAIEMLLEEIEVEINLINQAMEKAASDRNYDKVSEAVEKAKQATLLRTKLVDWRKEWEDLMVAHPEKDEEEVIRIERRNRGRLQRGLRTSEGAFRQPILKVLAEKGGSVRMNDVLPKVEQLMKGVLKPVDYEPLISQPNSPRWRNTAQWARDAMVKEGLLKSNSPHGVWEISETGRKALKNL